MRVSYSEYRKDTACAEVYHINKILYYEEKLSRIQRQPFAIFTGPFYKRRLRHHQDALKDLRSRKSGE